MAVLDAFNWAGTFGAFGFCGAYFIISIAAPVYLKRIGELKPMNVVMSVLAVLLLLVPAIGTVYPVPTPPVNYFPYIFGVYVLLGIIWIAGVRREKTIKPETLYQAEFADAQLEEDAIATPAGT